MNSVQLSIMGSTAATVALVIVLSAYGFKRFACRFLLYPFFTFWAYLWAGLGLLLGVIGAVLDAGSKALITWGFRTALLALTFARK